MRNLLILFYLLIPFPLYGELPTCASKYLAARHDAERLTALTRAFEAAARSTGIPIGLLVAVGIVESGLRQEARSTANAVGVMQITTEAEEHIRVIQRQEVRQTRGPPKPYTILFRTKLSTNIMLGAKYLELALIESGGSVEGALVMYNSGYYGLTRWKNNETVPNETAQYVLRVLRLQQECSK